MPKSRALLRGHEPAVIAVAPIIKIAGMLFGAVVLIAAVLYMLLRFEVMPHQVQLAARQGTVPPPPRLQVHAPDDLRVLRSQKQALLEGYRWLDPAHTAARVPIERAMQIYVQQNAAHGSTSEKR
jgi:hypothetical protein